MTPEQELEYLTLKKKKAMASSSDDGGPSKSYDVPRPLQEAAKFVTGPGRLTRGIGVGIEQLIPSLRSGQGLLGAGAKASAAMQPGYQPQEGEKLGAFAGGQLDPINLLMAEATGGGSLLKNMAGGAATSGGASILDQMSQGQVKPGNVAMDTVLGGGVGGLAHGMAKTPSYLLNKAPMLLDIFHTAPKKAVEIFKKNPGIEKTAFKSDEEAEAAIADKTDKLIENLKEYHRGAGMNFDQAITQVKAKMTPSERSKWRPIPSGRVSDVLESMKMAVNSLYSTPEKAAKVPEQTTSSMFKALLHLRQSIDEHVKYSSSSGASPVPSVAQGGLSALRPQVNQLIERLPGNEVLRNADKVSGMASDMYGKLQKNMERPGEAIEFLKNTFAGKGPNAKEDMRALYALEEFTGKPVVNDLFKAMTMSHFSKNLAGNVFSRSIAGLSPFVISALLRSTVLPGQFQAALIGGTSAVSALRSPKLMGKAIRALQKSAKPLAGASKPTAIAALNAIRSMSENFGSQ